MFEMTLKGLLKTGKSKYGQEANYLVIQIQVGEGLPEIIINPHENFDAKFEYYSQEYNEDLTLKANPKIKIVDYSFVYNLSNYFNNY